jgi:phage gp29-like protein
VLGTRKRQVSQLDMTIEAGGTDVESKKIAEAAQEQFLDSGLIDDAIFDILDAVGKGFSLAEIMWDLEGNSWNIKSLEYVDPRFIRFDRETRRVPLLRADNDGGLGLPLAPFKFLYTEIKSKSGIPVRSGIARPIAWIWMFKNFAVKDWVQFCEIYGMPLRVGKYAPGSSQEDIGELVRALSQISSDAAAAIPSNMIIEILGDGAKSASGGVHESLARFLDEQTSKIVLGQTGTTDATPGKLGGAPDHTQVREDIERADTKALMACCNRQLIRPWVDFNYGRQAKYPWLWIGRPEPKNVAIMVDTAAKLVPLGLKVRQADIWTNVGFTEPQDGDVLLTMPAAGAAPAGGNPITTTDMKTDLSSLRMRIELLAAEIKSDAIDRATGEQLARWKPLVQPAVDQLEKAFAAAESYEDLQKRLSALGARLDMNPLADRLARLTFQAFAAGRLGQPIKAS